MIISHAKIVEIANIALRALWRINSMKASGTSNAAMWAESKSALNDIGMVCGCASGESPARFELQ